MDDKLALLSLGCGVMDPEENQKILKIKCLGLDKYGRLLV